MVELATPGCPYCANARTPCTCLTDCGIRQGGVFAHTCGKAPSYPDSQRHPTPMAFDPIMAQYELQRQAYGLDPDTMTGEERASYFTWNVTALVFELGEAGNEIGWKPWATDRFTNAEEYNGELVDAFHFLMNLVALGGWNWDEFVAAYLKKRQKNIERQLNGYDGRTGKCPKCHRDIEESASMHPETTPGGPRTCLA